MRRANGWTKKSDMHDLEQAEGWEAAVLKLEERLKMARTDMAAGRAPTRSPET